MHQEQDQDRRTSVSRPRPRSLTLKDYKTVLQCCRVVRSLISSALY